MSSVHASQRAVFINDSAHNRIIEFPSKFFADTMAGLLILFVSWLFCSLDVQVASLRLTCTGRSFLVIPQADKSNRAS